MLIQQTVPWQLSESPIGTFTGFSFIRRSLTQPTAQRSYGIFSLRYATVNQPGAWDPLSKGSWRIFGGPWGRIGSSVLSVGAWIPQ